MKKNLLLMIVVSLISIQSFAGNAVSRLESDCQSLGGTYTETPSGETDPTGLSIKFRTCMIQTESSNGASKTSLKLLTLNSLRQLESDCPNSDANLSFTSSARTGGYQSDNNILITSQVYFEAVCKSSIQLW